MGERVMSADQRFSIRTHSDDDFELLGRSVTQGQFLARSVRVERASEKRRRTSARRRPA